MGPIPSKEPYILILMIIVGWLLIVPTENNIIGEIKEPNIRYTEEDILDHNINTVLLCGLIISPVDIDCCHLGSITIKSI